jgi:hypothetical protein
MLWETTNGLGDQMIDRCRLEPASKAAIGLSSGAAILQATFMNCHLGSAPYGIRRFGSAGGRLNAMDGVVMRNCSFEGFGNGAIYDEVGDATFNITFIFYGEAASLTGSARWPGKPVRAAFDLNELNATFIGRSASTPFDPGDTGGLDAGGNPIIIQLQSDVVKYDLLTASGLEKAATYSSDASSYPVGVAAGAGTAGDWIAYYRRGRDGSGLRCRLAAGQSIAGGRLFKPDAANPGCVVQASSAADGPIVGRAIQPGGPGGSFEAELF